MKHRLEGTVLLGMMLVGLAIQHRGILFSGGEAVPGGFRDHRLAVFLLEHWNRSLKGEAWQTPPYFHPETNTLGYTDTFFLFAPPYIVARRLGMDIYSSYEASLMMTSIVAFATMALLLRRFEDTPAAD